MNPIDKDFQRAIEFDDYLEQRKMPKRFEPPSLGEVTAYCKERGRGIDPQLWYDFYTSKGWMVGKNKMVDWRAAVRTWERNLGRNLSNRERVNGEQSEKPERKPADLTDDELQFIARIHRGRRETVPQGIVRELKHRGLLAPPCPDTGVE